MPTNDFTSKLLDLEDAIIENTNVFTDHVEIHFSLPRRTQTCPACGAATDKVHDYRTSVIKDIPISGKRTYLHYRKRRYHCNCCGKHFYEPFSQVPKHCHTTLRLTMYTLSLLSKKMSAKDIADAVGISNSTSHRWIQFVSFPKPNLLPAVLSIDEFKGNTEGNKFQTILTNPKTHQVFDILRSRTQVTLIDYFRSFPNRKEVKYFVMDMNQVYRDIARTFFPNAKIVIDRFHVVRYVTWALENVRKRVQKSMHPDKRKYFKRSRRLLLSHKEKLSESGLEALEVMLLQSQDLATAYHLKELFYEFMDSEDRTEAAYRLHNFILFAQASELTEFKACLTMLGNWSQYILNSFECPYSNGFTEGSNNAIKVIKRIAFGYRNFDNFRNRILLTLNT